MGTAVVQGSLESPSSNGLMLATLSREYDSGVPYVPFHTPGFTCSHFHCADTDKKSDKQRSRAKVFFTNESRIVIPICFFVVDSKKCFL